MASVLLTGCALAGGGSAPSPGEDTHLLLFDVRYDAGRIRQVGRLDPDPGEDLIDLDGAYLCAGLVDAHVHLSLGAPIPGSALPSTLPTGASGASVDANAAAHIAHGITAVRDLGGKEMDVSGLGGVPHGPRIVSCGAAITRSGHYGGFLGVSLPAGADPVATVRTLIGAGAGVIKVILTGSIDLDHGTVAPPHFTPRELLAITAAAHEKGIPVAVHANGSAAIVMAAEARADSVEHGILGDEASVAALAESGTVWVPTLTPLHALAAGSAGRGRWEALPAVMARHEAMVARGREEGVRVAAGTDAGSPGVPHGALAAEVAHLRGLGFTGPELRTAVGSVAADLLGLGPGYGRLEAGAATDLVWFEHDPFATPAADLSALPVPLGVLGGNLDR